MSNQSTNQELKSNVTWGEYELSLTNGKTHWTENSSTDQLENLMKAGQLMINKLHLTNLLERELTSSNEELSLAQERETASGEAMDSMERTYWEGYTDALEFIKRELGVN